MRGASIALVCMLVACGSTNVPEDRGVELQANDASDDDTTTQSNDSSAAQDTGTVADDSSAPSDDSSAATETSPSDAPESDAPTSDAPPSDAPDTCACPAPDPTRHEVATCTGGVCGVTCAPGWKACTGGTTKGCQTDVYTDTFNCGDCKIKCPWDKPFCKVGVCTP